MSTACMTGHRQGISLQSVGSIQQFPTLCGYVDGVQLTVLVLLFVWEANQHMTNYVLRGNVATAVSCCSFCLRQAKVRPWCAIEWEWDSTPQLATLTDPGAVGKLQGVDYVDMGQAQVHEVMVQLGRITTMVGDRFLDAVIVAPPLIVGDQTSVTELEAIKATMKRVGLNLRAAARSFQVVFLTLRVDNASQNELIYECLAAWSLPELPSIGSIWPSLCFNGFQVVISGSLARAVAVIALLPKR